MSIIHVTRVVHRRARTRPAASALAPPSLKVGGPMTILIWTAAVVLLFEEWFWNQSTRAIARFSVIAHLSALESWIRRRPPAQALMLFVVPVLAIYPFKALALFALAKGNLALGTTAFVAAKLAATAVFAWLYELTEPAIVHFAWIRLARLKFLALRAFIHAWLNARPGYRRARALIRGHTTSLAYRYRVACRLHSRRRRARIRASAYRTEILLHLSVDTVARARSRGARRR